MSQACKSYNVSEISVTRLNQFLYDNGEFITKIESKGNDMIEIYRYNSSTVIISEYDKYIFLGVCDTGLKSKEAFNELEKILLGRK